MEDPDNIGVVPKGRVKCLRPVVPLSVGTSNSYFGSQGTTILVTVHGRSKRVIRCYCMQGKRAACHSVCRRWLAAFRNFRLRPMQDRALWPGGVRQQYRKWCCSQHISSPQLSDSSHVSATALLPETAHIHIYALNQGDLNPGESSFRASRAQKLHNETSGNCFLCETSSDHPDSRLPRTI